MSAPAPFRVTVLLSGTGRSLENLVARVAAESVPIALVRVISSRADVRGLDVAREAGIPTAVVARRDHADVTSFSEQLTRAIGEDAPDLVVMAGFLSLYRLPDALAGRVINIHPSLLPLFGGKGFYGDRVHRAAIEAGVRISGCTVHFVDNEYDQGPIILQRAVSVLPTDDVETLAARVFAAECQALPEAVAWLARGWVRCEGRRTVYADEALPRL